MRLLAIVPLLAVLQAAEAAAQSCPDAAALDTARSLPIAVVRYLADDALQGRLAGSAGERCAGELIAREFARLGLAPAGDSGSYFQAVPLASAVNPHAPGGTGRNVVAILEGADPALKGEAVVVGAHYDHLGLGGFGSMVPEVRDSVHNGADDNASGVGALLGVAERLARAPRPARSVVFIAFTGEEYGLLGSGHYTKQPAVPLEQTVAMVNMDMVGRLGSNPLIVYGAGTAQEWEEVLAAASGSSSIELRTQSDGGFGASDQTSFYARDIPVLHFFTNVHSDYHRPSDDWQKIDAAGLERVAALVAGVVEHLAQRPTRLTLVPGVGAPPSTGGRGYGPYLGTVPDFTPVERGVLLAGVNAGSPAEQAGLRRGDIIVGFDGAEIKDIYALTDALRAHEPGDEVKITVLRDGESVTVTARLAQRRSEQ